MPTLASKNDASLFRICRLDSIESASTACSRSSGLCKIARCRIYKNVADKTAKYGYRADVREDAVARVSAIRRSQKPKKESPPKKPRGAAARKAENESA